MAIVEKHMSGTVVVDDPIVIRYGPIPATGSPCGCCGKPMFAVETPAAAEYYTCPLCEEWAGRAEHQLDAGVYCAGCGIIFDTGRVHAENGCEDSVYSAMLVESFTVGGETTRGMPRFKSMADFERAEKFVAFNWVGTKHPHCEKAFHPFSEHP